MKDAEIMAKNPNRPLSPHLQVYRWSPQMITLLWWLSAIGGGAESYATFQKYVVSAGESATGFETAINWFFRLLGLAVTFSFFQHLASGIRHLVLDIGAGYELKANRTWASAAFIAAFFATAFVVLFVAPRFLGV
ncbi:MAG: succinate:quinone oxidoreductase subunit C [Sphingomonadaceae bacterium]|uniref:succinate dehydrogenase, cytochrome b556 subunit n=1 Tax=Sphingorhabdus sp. TaxID=1902408 RepID=UPI0039BC3EE9|nr:succinate:quinone oxidoreductase subunit C [Sphingomonadaceae bacterium]